MAQLARVVDTDALARSDGPRASFGVAVPAAWLERGARIEIAAPRLLHCDRCDGGGCDGCDRKGAFRGPGDAAARTFCLQLPAGHGSGCKVRLAQPFEGVEQLVVVVRVGPASERVQLVALDGPATTGGHGGRALHLAVTVVLVLVASALAWWLAG